MKERRMRLTNMLIVPELVGVHAAFHSDDCSNDYDAVEATGDKNNCMRSVYAALFLLAPPLDLQINCSWSKEAV